jgi:hypothetical protein
MSARTKARDRRGGGAAPDDARPRRETAEQAYRRIACRKLRKRGVPEHELEARLERITKGDATFRFDLAEILGDRSDSAP